MYKQQSFDQIVKQMSLSVAAQEAKTRALKTLNDVYVTVDGRQIIVNPTLIAFLSAIKSANIDTTVVLDIRNIPVVVSTDDLLTNAIAKYHEAANQYAATMANIGRHRTVKSLMGQS